jgi:hypothetical protein
LTQLSTSPAGEALRATSLQCGSTLIVGTACAMTRAEEAQSMTGMNISYSVTRKAKSSSRTARSDGPQRLG